MKSRYEFDAFLGREQGRIFEDDGTALGVRLWLERVLGFYGEKGGVDVEIIDGMLPIHPRTVEYLYADYTPLRLEYVPGSRPFLEQILAAIVTAGMSEREKALAVMRRCRDNARHASGMAEVSFCGGTEEEIIKHGSCACQEVSRVFVCLCQMAGLPARVFCSHITGHMMAEVRADGKWAWMDPLFGLAPLNDRGEPASARELLEAPTLFERQSRGFWDDCLPKGNFAIFSRDAHDERNLAHVMASFRDCYFNPREALALGNYFVWDHARYTYPWRVDPADPARLQEARRREAVNCKALGWPDYYFNGLLADEGLKMR